MYTSTCVLFATASAQSFDRGSGRLVSFYFEGEAVHTAWVEQDESERWRRRLLLLVETRNLCATDTPGADTQYRRWISFQWTGRRKYSSQNDVLIKAKFTGWSFYCCPSLLSKIREKLRPPRVVLCVEGVKTTTMMTTTNTPRLGLNYLLK